MVDNVIITLVYGEYQFDMEFPANINVGRLRPLIIEALWRKGLRVGTSFNLICNGSTLCDSDTFLAAGVWDGSYLTVA